MKEQKRVPKLRFDEFSGEWEEKKYGEIYSFYSTNSFSRDKLNYEVGTVKNIHYGDIHTKFSTLFDIENEDVPYVNDEVDLGRLKEENYLREGDLLIADASENYNDIGKTIEVVNLNNERIISGLHTFHARPDKQNMQIGFSGYMLQNWFVRKQVMQIAQGTKVLGLATSRLGKIILNIPSLPEQQKIASFLTAVDKKLVQLQEKKSLLEAYKKGLMQQIFSQELRFIKEHGSAYPDWEEKQLGEIGKTINGLTGKTKENFGTGKPYIQYKQIFDGSKINIKDCGLVDIKENERQTKVRFGDVFFTTSSETPNEIGTASVLLDEVEEMYLNSFCFGLRIKQNVLNPSFAQFLFRSTEFRRKMIPLAQGSTRYNISKSSFLKLNVELPCIDEQNKIAKFLSAIDGKIDIVQKQIEQTQTFKKGLLQQMFV